MNSKKTICPFCGKRQYETFEGDYVDVEVGMIKVSGNESYCNYCGFRELEGSDTSNKKNFKNHKKQTIRDIKSYRKWCDYMETILRLEGKY